MSSPEGRGYQPEEPDRQEGEPLPYYRAARFQHERQAARSYQSLQDLVFGSPADLSVYRFLLEQAAYVTVLGEPPEPELEHTITAHLAAGEPVALPHGVLLALAARRQQARRLGPWVEGHYGPGTPP